MKARNSRHATSWNSEGRTTPSYGGGVPSTVTGEPGFRPPAITTRAALALCGLYGCGSWHPFYLLSYTSFGLQQPWSPASGYGRPR